MTRYKISLYRYQRVRGYEEEHIFANFDPAKVDGFGVIATVKRQSKPVENLTKP